MEVSTPTRRARTRALKLGTRFVALAAALLALLAAGCGSGDSSSSTNSQGGSADKPELTVGVTGEFGPTDLSPIRTAGIPIPVQLWSETLVTADARSGTYEPALATEFGYVGEGNKAYQVTLRRGVRFSDGSPLDAAALKAWLLYFQRAGGVGSNLIPISSIDTPDRWTVKLNLSAPTPGITSYFGRAWGWGWVNKVTDPKAISEDPVTVGPYVLVPSQTVVGDHYTVKPNKYYYDPSKIKYSKIVVKVIANPSTMLQAAKTGELDVAIGDLSTADAAAAAGLNVQYGPSSGWAGIVIGDRSGTRSKPLADVRVRQALNYAIDRETITQAMVSRYGTPTSQPRSIDGTDPALDDYYSYDPARARQLLAEAGYPNGFTLRVISPTFMGNVGDPTTQAIAKYLQAVGVKLDISPAGTVAAYGQKILSKDWAAWMFNQEPGIGMASMYAAFIKKDGPGNYFGWHDPAADAIAAKALTAPEDEVADYWRQITRRAVEQAYWVPTYVAPVFLYASDQVGGVSVTRWFQYTPALLQWYPK